MYSSSNRKKVKPRLKEEYPGKDKLTLMMMRFRMNITSLSE